MSETPAGLIEQALDNLVNQFANPMDFLRELVQNSIDAGSPRIEVEVRHKPGRGHFGVAEIDIRDFGQGMDESVIDSQLTRLFSSAKEGDRTAIGKFGIGFTSVFALRPNVVRVVTGKHGENWEVLFHEDRTFEKRRLDGVVSGTTITVYKRLRSAKVADLVRDARESLVYWCEHALTPIAFLDRTDGEEPEQADSDDVFAVFEREQPEAEVLNQPFGLPDAVVSVEHEADGVRVVVGYDEAPSWCFFSGGLTLLRSEDPGHLGPYEKDFRGISFKILSPTVGHTLTRDNVIQDEAWHTAMAVAKQAAVQLRAQVVEQLVTSAREGDRASLATWHGRLVPDLAREPLDTKRPVLLDPLLEPLSLYALVERVGAFGAPVWAVDPADERLARAMVEAGLAAFAADPRTEALLSEALPDLEVLAARDHFCVPRRVPSEELEPREVALIEQANALASDGLTLHLGDLGVHSPRFFVEGRSGKRLYRLPRQTLLHGFARGRIRWLQGWIGGRHFLVNRSHPHLRALLDHPDVGLAAYALVQAVVVEDGHFPDATLFHLRHDAEDALVPHGS